MSTRSSRFITYKGAMSVHLSVEKLFGDPFPAARSRSSIIRNGHATRRPPRVRGGNVSRSLPLPDVGLPRWCRRTEWLGLRGRPESVSTTKICQFVHQSWASGSSGCRRVSLGGGSIVIVWSVLGVLSLGCSFATLSAAHRDKHSSRTSM